MEMQRELGELTVPPTNIFFVNVFPLPVCRGTAALASTLFPSMMCSRCCTCKEYQPTIFPSEWKSPAAKYTLTCHQTAEIDPSYGGVLESCLTSLAHYW